MSILSGFLKTKRRRLTDEGYILQSEWTSAETVEMPSGKTLAEYNPLSGSDIVDNLLSTATDLPLSANQGRILWENFSQAHDALVASLAYSGLGVTENMTFAEIAEILAATYPAYIQLADLPSTSFTASVFSGAGSTAGSGVTYQPLTLKLQMPNKSTWGTVTAITNDYYDFTAFNKLEVLGSITGNNYNSFRVRIIDEAENITILHTESWGINTSVKLSLDVSAYTGKYKIQLGQFTENHTDLITTLIASCKLCG